MGGLMFEILRNNTEILCSNFILFYIFHILNVAPCIYKLSFDNFSRGRFKNVPESSKVTDHIIENVFSQMKIA